MKFYLKIMMLPLLWTLSFTAHAFAVLPVSLHSNVQLEDSLPSLSLRLENLQTQQIEPFYFVLYPNNQQTFTFYGNQYRILSAQLQHRDLTLNNVCGLRGHTVSADALQLALSGILSDEANTANQLHCTVTLEHFSTQ